MSTWIQSMFRGSEVINAYKKINNYLMKYLKCRNNGHPEIPGIFNARKRLIYRAFELFDKN